MICPAAVSPATEGLFGYLSSNKDATTGYNLVTGLGSVDVTNLAAAWGDLLTASTVVLSPSAVNIVTGASETITVTVTPSTASGVVTLSDLNNSVTTTLGTVTITGGTGTFTTTSLPVGTNSIAGSYVGTNKSSASVAVTVTVTAPDFTLHNTGGVSASVFAGVTATGYAFTVAPLSPATTFAANVTLVCTGLPANTSCAFSTNPILAGAVSTSETLTITTTGPNTAGGTSQLRRRADNRSPWLPLAMPLAGIVMAGFAGRFAGGRLSKYSVIAGICVSLALLGMMVACGGGSSTPPAVAVSVSAGTPANVFPNDAADSWPAQTAQFTATVTNTTNTAVTWAVTTANGGTISSTGLYTPPTIASGLPATVTVTATSAADTTKSGSSTETLNAATVPGTYTPITVTATEAGTNHTVSPTYTLIVQ
jgi:hypothetical protein